MTCAASRKMDRRGHGSFGPVASRSAQAVRTRSSTGDSSRKARKIRFRASKGAVGAVAGRLISGVLASAKVDRRRRFRPVFNGRELRTFMRTIAKGLGLALTTRAPPVALTFGNIYVVWRFLRDVWRCHSLHPPLTRCRHGRRTANRFADVSRSKSDATVAEGHPPDKMRTPSCRSP